MFAQLLLLTYMRSIVYCIFKLSDKFTIFNYQNLTIKTQSCGVSNSKHSPAPLAYLLDDILTSQDHGSQEVVSAIIPQLGEGNLQRGGGKMVGREGRGIEQGVEGEGRGRVWNKGKRGGGGYGRREEGRGRVWNKGKRGGAGYGTRERGGGAGYGRRERGEGNEVHGTSKTGYRATLAGHMFSWITKTYMHLEFMERPWTGLPLSVYITECRFIPGLPGMGCCM